MKRYFLLIMMLATALFFEGCRGDEGPMGPMGPAGRDGRDGRDGEGLNVLNAPFTADDWTLVKGDEPYFECQKDFPELESGMVEYGIVTPYLVWTGNDGKEYLQNLPAVRHHASFNDETQETFYYTQTIDCEFAAGTITFFVTNSDFYVKELPENMKFKVVCHY